MDDTLTRRLDTLVVLNSVVLGGVLTAAFFSGAEERAIVYTLGLGALIAVLALGAARGGYT